MSSATSTARFVLEQSTLVPALLACFVAPNAALRIWLAVKQLPAPPYVPAEQLAAEQRRGRIISFLTIGTIWAVEVFVVSTGKLNIFDALLRVICAFSVQNFLMMVSNDLSRATTWAVHRHGSGALVLRTAPDPEHLHKARLIMSVICATAINAAAYFTTYRLPAVLVTFAIVYAMLAQAPVQKISIRWTAIFLLGYLAVSIVVSSVVVVAVTMFGGGFDGDSSSKQADEMESVMTGHYVSSFLSSVFAIAPVFLIAVCYRFDYAQHLSKTGESSPVLKTVDAPPNSPTFSAGVLRPARAPSSFAKPYFTASLLSWLAAHGITAALMTFVIPAHFIEEFKTGQLYDVTILFFAVPLMTIGLVLAGLIRGELKQLWKYEEEWRVKPVAAGDQAEDNVALQDGTPESQLASPVYTDEKDADAATAADKA